MPAFLNKRRNVSKVEFSIDIVSTFFEIGDDLLIVIKNFFWFTNKKSHYSEITNSLFIVKC